MDLKRSRWEISIALSVKSTKNFKKLKCICDATLLLSGICNKCGSEDEKKIKDEKEESIEILKTLVLINNI